MTPFEELVIELDLDKSGAAKFIHFPDLAIDHVVSIIKQPNHQKQYLSYYFMVAKKFCEENDLKYDQDLYRAAQAKYGYQSKPIKSQSIKQPRQYDSSKRMNEIKDEVIIKGLARLKIDKIYAQKWARIARHEIPHEALKDIVKLDPIYAELLPEFV